MVKLLLYGISDSGLSTVFHLFKILPNTTPLTSVSSNNTTLVNTLNIVSDHHGQSDHEQTSTLNTASSAGSSYNSEDSANDDEDEKSPITNTSQQPTDSSTTSTYHFHHRPMKPIRPPLPNLLLSPALSSPTFSTSTPVSSPSSSPVKILRRKKQAFSEHKLRSMPFLFLSQILMDMKSLIQDAQDMGWLYKTEEEMTAFLEQRVEYESLRKYQESITQILISNYADPKTALDQNPPLLSINNNHSNNSSNASSANNSPSTPTSSNSSAPKKHVGKKIKNLVDQYENIGNNITNSDQSANTETNILENYKELKTNLEKILQDDLKEQQQTRGRSDSGSGSLLIQRLKRKKKRRSTINAQEIPKPEEPKESTSQPNRNLPPHYCDYCHKMAESKVEWTMRDGKIQFKSHWKVESTKEIVERIKAIQDPNQLISVRLRSEFFKDILTLWENHIGIQHTFHAHSLFKNNKVGNTFAALPAIMKHVVSSYLLFLPSQCFATKRENMEAHASELGEGMTTHLDKTIPVDTITLLDHEQDIGTIRDYKFKFNLAPTSTHNLPVGISITNDSSSSNPPPSRSEIEKDTWSVLSSSFTSTTNETRPSELSQSEPGLSRSVNAHLYGTLSKYRGSATKDAVAAVRPLIIEQIEQVEEPEKKVMSPRKRFMNFFKGSTQSPTLEQPPTRFVRKTPTRQPRQNTTAIFNVITMGGVNPNIVFSKKDWIACCYGSHAVIFVVNLCDYYKTIMTHGEYSDNLIEKNKLAYSLEKFEQCVNGKYFSDTPIVLAFTFPDVFRESLKYYPLDANRKYEIEQIVQQLNPAAYGQKQTDPHIESISKKLGASQSEEWHSSCEFIIDQFLHVCTAQERRSQIRRDFVILNCIDGQKTLQTLVTDVLLNDEVLPCLASDKGDSSENFDSPRDTRGINDGSKTDRSHHATKNSTNTVDYSQYYYRRCRNVPSSTKEQPSKITKSKKSLGRKGGEKLRKTASQFFKKRRSWNGGKVELDEETIVIDDHVVSEEEDDGTTTARRKRKNSHQCLLQ